MSAIILDDIPFQADVAVLQQRLHVREGSRQVAQVEQLVAEAEAIARPKALYKLAHVDSKGGDHVVIAGVRFDSRVLRVNLDAAQHVIPHIATCGMELSQWANGIADALQRYYADGIKYMALSAASAALNAHLVEQYGPGETSCISPGVFPEWPLSQQRPLFELLGDPQASIGVQLLKSYLMVPSKSVSGILFSNDEGFLNCELCDTEDCRGRRAPFDKGLYDRKYGVGAQV